MYSDQDLDPAIYNMVDEVISANRQLVKLVTEKAIRNALVPFRDSIFRAYTHSMEDSNVLNIILLMPEDAEEERIRILGELASIEIDKRLKNLVSIRIDLLRNDTDMRILKTELLTEINLNQY